MGGRFLVALARAVTAAAPAAAAVKDSSHDAFTLARTIDVAAAPDRVYGSPIDIAKWWNSEHTYSGEAPNLTLAARLGGCFCERLKTGGVEHLRVVFDAAGKTLRLKGGLGPLQSSADGLATLSIAPNPSGGSTLSFTYRVWGYQPPDGLASIAGAVDSVWADALSRLKRHVETGSPV